jgi:predicted MFS family arabinose efflux permease
MVMLFGFGGLPFAIGATWLVRWLGEVGLSRVGGTLLALASLVIEAAPVWWWAAPACLAARPGFYMLCNTLQTKATQMAPARRGADVSAFASCFFLGQVFGVAVVNALVAHWGTGPVIACGAVGVALVALGFNRLIAQRVSAATIAAAR